MALHLAYQSLWLQGVLKPQSDFKGGLREWIAQGGWSPEAVLKPKKADFLVFDRLELVDALVNDFLVLSTAAFESAASVFERAGDPNGCAWQVISYYYSAYFAANAIMRLAGYVCTNLDADSCIEINNTAYLYSAGGTNDSDKIKSGPFYCVFSSRPVDRFVLRSLDGVKGGVHIQFWHGFMKFLDETDMHLKTAPLTAADIKQARAELADLKSVLTYGGKQNGSWLSEVRNAVNYRFEKGVWFPYEGAVVTGSSLRESLRKGIRGTSGILAPATASPDCARLVSVSGFLLRWLEAALGTIESKARYKKRSHIRNGALAFAAVI